MSAILKVDLNSIRKNILKYKSNLSEARKICAVVKADCYGLGSKIICREIDECVDYFAVSSEGEFLEIQNIVSKPVILLTPIYENITLLAGYGLEFCVSNKTQFERFLIFAKQNINIKIKIHIAVNTGMNRYGFSKISDIFEIVNKCQKTQNISIIGVFSHFYMGDNKNISNFQLHKLTEIKNCLSDKFDISHHFSEKPQYSS